MRCLFSQPLLSRSTRRSRGGRRRRGFLLAVVVLCSGAVTGVTAQESLFTTSLTVESTPAGATIFLDGRPQGKTPLTLSEVRPGRRRLRLEYRGYRTVEQWIDLPAGTDYTHRVELESLRRRVNLVHRIVHDLAGTGTEMVPVVLEGYLNGRWRPVTSLELLPGTHTLEVRAFGYVAQTVSIVVPELFTDDALTREIVLEKISDPAVTVSIVPPFTCILESNAPAPYRISVFGEGEELLWETAGILIAPSTSLQLPLSPGDYTVVVEPAGVYGITVPRSHHFLTPPLSDIGWGTALLPLPMEGHSRFWAIAVGGGVIGRGETEGPSHAVPVVLRGGGSLFPWLALSAGGSITAEPDRTAPAGVGTAGITVSPLLPVSALSIAAHYQGRFSTEGRLDGKLALPLLLRPFGDASDGGWPIAVAVVPGMDTDFEASTGFVAELRTPSRYLAASSLFFYDKWPHYTFDAAITPGEGAVTLQTAFTARTGKRWEYTLELSLRLLTRGTLRYEYKPLPEERTLPP